MTSRCWSPAAVRAYRRVGMARCDVRAAFSGAKRRCDSHLIEHSISPLNAVWDGAARHPYPPEGTAVLSAGTK